MVKKVPVTKSGGAETKSSGDDVKTVIDHLKDLCDFPDDSTMVKFIDQQGWTKLKHVTTVGLDDVKDFATTKDDGSYEARPLMIHLRLFKCFLLYYNRKCREFSTKLDEEDVLAITKTEFEEYCGSAEYHEDVATGLAPKTKVFPPPMNTNDGLTALEFRRGVKRDKTHYTALKDDKHFNSWNRGFVATAHMHHTHLVLDARYRPVTEDEKAVFHEVQTFMYAVLEENLKTDKGKSLVSQFELTRDAQRIYYELKKHAQSTTAAQITGDTLLQYITTARYPGNWRGTSYSFVLHWKEQVMQYERLELEDFPAK